MRPLPPNLKPPTFKNSQNPSAPRKRPAPDKIATFARETLKKIKSERRGPAARGKLTLAEIAMGQMAGMKATNPYAIDRDINKLNKEE